MTKYALPSKYEPEIFPDAVIFPVALINPVTYCPVLANTTTFDVPETLATTLLSGAGIVKLVVPYVIPVTPVATTPVN